MKISKEKAETLIKSGVAWVEGKMTDGHRYPEGDEYWIVTDSSTMQTHHVLVDDAPELDRVA